MPSLENQYYSIQLDPTSERYQILSKQPGGLFLRSAFPAVRVTEFELPTTITPLIIGEWGSSRQELERLGTCQVGNSPAPADDRIALKVQFALPEKHPLVCLRVCLQNNTESMISQNQFTLLASTQVALSETVNSEVNLGCYVNGWQSWSYSGTYGANQKPMATHLGAFQKPKLHDPGTPVTTRAGDFTSDMFGVLLDRTHRTGFLAGFLSQKAHFGHVRMQIFGTPALQVYAAGDGAHILPGTGIWTDWLALEFFHLDDPDPLANYLDLVASVNDVHIRGEPPIGWCSWYHYFSGISPDDLRENLLGLTEIRDRFPASVFQIDDGYEKLVGDWLEPRTVFENEMDALAEEIREEKLTPGLWLAPFIASPTSSLAKKHSDWLIHKPDGKLANAGWNWEGFCRGLDLTHPEVKDYLRKVIQKIVQDWGYTYLKLDFLYAGAIAGNHFDPTLTRAQILRQGMELIREAAGAETYLLGCGAPLGPMLGIVDGMRVGTDAAPDWDSKYLGLELLFPNDPDLPSTKNAIQNTLTRAFLHRRWWHNDPDCLLLRPTTGLTLAEVQTLASAIFMSGGLLIDSDSVKEISNYRMKIVQAMVPLLPTRPQVIDWADQLNPAALRQPMDGWDILEYINWSAKPIQADLQLSNFGLDSERPYVIRQYWDSLVNLVRDGRVVLRIPPHGNALLAVRPFDPAHALYLGSNLHFSQGLELVQWIEEEMGVHLKLALMGHHTEGLIDVYLPQSPQRVHSEATEIPCKEIGKGFYRLEVEFDDELEMEIMY